jgi:large subunit ribosomal protein L21
VYAVIEDSGQQFRVSEGDVLDVDVRDPGPDAARIDFDRVLLIGDEGRVTVGTPVVAGAKVVAEVVDAAAKGPKVHAYYWRRRKASRKKIGHRQRYLRVRITGIEA